MFITGLIAACAILFLLLKFNLRRILKHEILIDICVTFFLIWIFAGTFAGMMAGLMAGPQEKLKFVKTETFPYRSFRWVKI